MILAVTGHRPPDLGGYSPEAFELLVELAKQKFTQLLPDHVLSGFALGWDMACAKAAWEMNIPYHAYIPFAEQSKPWPKSSRYLWQTLKENARSVEIVGGQKYDRDFLFMRNQRLVDDGESLLACFNGYEYSGTADTIVRANKKGISVHNCFNEWQDKFKEAGYVS